MFPWNPIGSRGMRFLSDVISKLSLSYISKKFVFLAQWNFLTLKKQFIERINIKCIFFISVNDTSFEKNSTWFSTYFSGTKLGTAIRVVTYGRFDFTGDLRLPRSNTSPKKGYREKRNIVVIFPQRKTYSWSDKNASSIHWQAILLLINCRGCTLHTYWSFVLIFKIDVKRNVQANSAHTHVITIFRLNLILSLPLHVANITAFIFLLINFVDSISVLYPHCKNRCRGIKMEQWKPSLFFEAK